MDLNCLTVASARLMCAGFLVWLAEPALSSAPHFEGAQFSVKGLSSEGPERNGFWANAGLAKTTAIAVTRIGQNQVLFGLWRALTWTGVTCGRRSTAPGWMS